MHAGPESGRLDAGAITFTGDAAEMSEQTNALAQLAMQRAQAMRLAEAGLDLYDEIVATLQATINPDGSGDFDQLARRLNAALTAYSPRAEEVRRLRAE